MKQIYVSLWLILMLSCQNQTSDQSTQINTDPTQGLIDQIKDFYLKQGGFDQNQGIFWYRDSQQYLPLLSMSCIDLQRCESFFEYLSSDLKSKNLRLIKVNENDVFLDQFQSPIKNHAYFATVIDQNKPLIVLRLLPDPYLFVSMHTHPSLDQESLLLMNSEVNLILDYPRDESLISSLNALKREFFFKITDDPQSQYLQIQQLMSLKQPFLGIAYQRKENDAFLDQIIDVLDQKKGILIEATQLNLKAFDPKNQKIRLISTSKTINGGDDLIKDLQMLEGEILVNGHAVIDFKPQSKEDLTKFLEFLDKMIQKKIKVIRASELAQ